MSRQRPADDNDDDDDMMGTESKTRELPTKVVSRNVRVRPCSSCLAVCACSLCLFVIVFVHFV
jgi:hypothetical protein